MRKHGKDMQAGLSAQPVERITVLRIEHGDSEGISLASDREAAQLLREAGPD
jgi:hypothetical protein